MASGRRGGPPDLKSTLGSLLRTTIEQVGAVREVVEQQARGRGGILDQALVQRRRREALLNLGETVHRLARRGELGDLALEPEIAMALAEIDEVDQESDEAGEPRFDESFARARGPEAVSSRDYRPPSAPASKGEYRVWRPVLPEDEDQSASEELATPEPPAPERSRSSSPRLPRKSAQRTDGGIRFVDEGPRPGDLDSDDDLESYMHEDDVPEPR